MVSLLFYKTAGLLVLAAMQGDWSLCEDEQKMCIWCEVLRAG